MIRIFFFLFFLLSIQAFGQTPDTTNGNLQSVTVTAYSEEPARKTSLNITPIKIDSLSKYGNFNLTDLLAKTPGVNALSTGVAIAKPVIRGLYGNRVLILLSSLKFDNQQWQEEHGLGLSDIGLSKVELIKGPMSILYGTEAIGGIINLVEEQKPKPYEHESDAAIKFHTNTMGGLVQGGYKANSGKSWVRVRAGIDNDADYSDGKGNRVLNSRFDGYYLKTTYGFTRKRWTCVNNLSSSYNRFGFIFNDIYNFVSPDARWSRNLSKNPAHMVLLNVFSSENKILLNNRTALSINAGVQSNSRRENEGGGAISLNMHLLTVQYLMKLEKRLSDRCRLIVSNLGSFEDNTNFGARKIVPDAKMQESNLSLYLETNLNRRWILENGIGAGEKVIKTYFTASVNGPDKEVKPFNKFSPYYNVFSGVSYMNENGVNVKLNLATGVRVANLAELSSNGLHEGVFTYEVGSPDLKNEQNFSLNFLANYTGPRFELSVSPFFNYFFNYIFLAPTSEQWYGFPVFRYKQQDARQFGTEATAALKPYQNLQIGSSYSAMISKTVDGNYTPFIPAQRITPFVSYKIRSKRDAPINLYANADCYAAQNNVYKNETATGGYTIINAGFSTSIRKNGATYDLSVAGNNLFNKAYYDHLSRFKYFGILNIGRNITIMLRVKLVGEKKHK